MKLKNLFAMACPGRAILAATFAMLTVNALHAASFFDNTISGINLGNASGGTSGAPNAAHSRGWAILALGNGSNGGVNIAGKDGATFYDGVPQAVGNIGIYSTSGTAGLTLSGYAGVQGSIYRDTSALVMNISGGSVYTGSNNVGVGGSGASGYLGTALSQALAARTAAGSKTNFVTGLTLGGALSTFTNSSPSTFSVTTSASIVTTIAATYVLNLATLNLNTAGMVLSLSAPSTANFVINIGTTLALSNAAKITLSGGLQPQNVLFNVKNGASVGMSGLGTIFNGIILAPTQNYTQTGGAVVYGEVIASKVTLSSNSRVINPIVSP